MKIPSLLPRLAALLLAIGLPASATEPWTFSFNMGGGPVSERLKEATQKGFGFGFSIEGSRALDQKSQLVASLGYQWFPGDNKLTSYIPKSVAATNVNPTIYETRNRKMDTGGIVVGLAYRMDLGSEDVFVQAGLKMGSIRTIEKDSGSQIVTNGLAITDTGSSTVSPNILAINTIVSQKEKTVFSVGPTVGLGYRMNETQAFTCSASMFKVSAHSAGTKTGWSTEFAFNVRF